MGGTSMGVAWAPVYVCLHLDLWEEEEDVFTSSMYQAHVHTWLRYINDILVVWKVDIEILHKFIDQLNNKKRNIHLTYTFERSQISFLDLWLAIEQGQLCTHTFLKEIAANTLLRADSHHPLWLKNGIPVGQLLRKKRNCTKTSKFRKEENEMYSRFHKRGYSHGQIRKTKKKVAGRSRESLLLIGTNKENGEQESTSPTRILTALFGHSGIQGCFPVINVRSVPL